MRRSFGFDVLARPRCGGRLRLIALIEDPSVVERFRRHLGLPTAIPDARRSTASPVTEALRTPSSTPVVECAPTRERPASGRAYHSCARPPSAQA